VPKPVKFNLLVWRLAANKLLPDDKPQIEGPLGAWRLTAEDYCQAVWSMFSLGGA